MRRDSHRTVPSSKTRETPQGTESSVTRLRPSPPGEGCTAENEEQAISTPSDAEIWHRLGTAIAQPGTVGYFSPETGRGGSSTQARLYDGQVETLVKDDSKALPPLALWWLRTGLPMSGA